MRAQVISTEETHEARKQRLAQEARASISDLTPRELEVLHAIGKGTQVAALASQLGMSQDTAWAHIASISAKTKTSATNGHRCDALRTIALRAGLTTVWS